MNTVNAINGEINTGDWVMAAPMPPYSFLVGQVTGIDALGSPDHDTDNETDDVHVNFIDAGYSDERQAGIIDAMAGVSHHAGKSIDAFGLDDVIMPPDALIRITDISREKFAELIENPKAGEAYYGSVMDAVAASKEAALIERFDKNLADYNASLEGCTAKELIAMAGRIADTNRMHAFITREYGMEVYEIDFFLQFQNPLEVVADAWHGYGDDIDGMHYVVNDVCNKQDGLLDYPLMADADPYLDTVGEYDGERRFMGVDLIDFLEKIAEKVIVHYPDDWKADVKRLHKAASSDDPDDKRLMWHVSRMGTHLNRERETFIRDTRAYNAWTEYPRRDSDTYGFVIEITGTRGGAVMGNVFDLGYYHAHVLHVRETALPIDMVTLSYTDTWGVNAGRTITVPRYEYDDDRHRLMSESGDVKNIEYHPYEGATKMSDLLSSERRERMAYPLGSMDAYLAQLDDVLADMRTQPEKTQAEKPKTLAEQLREAKAQVKSQENHKKSKSRDNRAER